MISTTIRLNQENASLVPWLTDEEYQSLKESIEQYGLWMPIIVNSQGVILDGRHRYKVCQELGIEEPMTVLMDFPDKSQEQMFVIDSNL